MFIVNSLTCHKYTFSIHYFIGGLVMFVGGAVAFYFFFWVDISLVFRFDEFYDSRELFDSFINHGALHHLAMSSW